MEIVTAHVLIQGHVQGIGFRRFVADVAEELDVSGIVENLSDGDVKAIATGERAVVERFIEQIKLGNGYSIIEKFTVKWHNGGKLSGEFNIVTTHLW